MELRIIFSMLSLFTSGVFHTAGSVPVPVPVQVTTPHSRPKRCSCASFLDKECVYFCHLDIIWVNTPERAVSYGLGTPSRNRRSVRHMTPDTGIPRCACTESTDGTCVSFCCTHSPSRFKGSLDRVISAAGEKCRKSLAAKTWGIKRDGKRAEPSFLRATRQLRLILKKWTVKSTTH